MKDKAAMQEWVRGRLKGAGLKGVRSKRVMDILGDGFVDDFVQLLRLRGRPVGNRGTRAQQTYNKVIRLIVEDLCEYFNANEWLIVLESKKLGAQGYVVRASDRNWAVTQARRLMKDKEAKVVGMYKHQRYGNIDMTHGHRAAARARKAGRVRMRRSPSRLN